MNAFVDSQHELTAAVPTIARQTPVMAQHENGEMYPATYRGVNARTGQHIVEWKEGGEVENVNHVVPTVPLQLANVHPGTEIEADWMEDGESCGTFGATVEAVNGRSLTVRWHVDNTKATINFSTVVAIYASARDPSRTEPDDLAKAAAGDDADKLTYLKNLWTELNRTKFGGHMTMPQIKFFRNLPIQNMRGRGLWQSSASRRVITLNRRLFNKEGAVYETLLHEMCHEAVTEIDRVRETVNGGHGPHWTAWMRRVGLDPRRYDPTENVDYMDADEKLDMLQRRAAMSERQATPETLTPGTVVDFYKSALDKNTLCVVACQARKQVAVEWGKGKPVWALWLPGKTKYTYGKLEDLFIASDQSIGKTDAARLGVYHIQLQQGYKVENPLKKKTLDLVGQVSAVLWSMTNHVAGFDPQNLQRIPSVLLEGLKRTLRLNHIQCSDELLANTIHQMSRAGLVVLISGLDSGNRKQYFHIRNAERIKLTTQAVQTLQERYSGN